MIFQILRSLIPSMYFNFHYLPFRQAVKLPVLLYKPHLQKLGGVFRIEADRISTGMIRLGFPQCYFYPNAGVVFENLGGSIVINGRLNLGNNTAISVGQFGKLTLGNNVNAPASLKLACYHEVNIGDRTSFGWDCIVMDTDSHCLTYIEPAGGTHKGHGFGSITIGTDVWFGNGCLVMKGTKTPNKVVFGARSVINKNLSCEECTLLGGNPLRELRKNVFRNMLDDCIDYKQGCFSKITQN